MRLVPLEKDHLSLNMDTVMDYVDDHTIGITAILGITYTGKFDDVQKLDELVEAYNQEHPKLPIRIHVDGASGGMFAPFVEATMAINFSRSASQIVGQYYVLMRNGFEGFKEIQERTLDVARYLAAELKEMGIFEIYEDASHIPIVCWGLKDDADVEWSLYDLSDRLRMSGWLVPAYPMPADMQDTTVQRVVARADFSMQLCIKLVEDMKKEMDTLNKAKFVTGNTQGVIQTGFNHGGRSAVDKGEKVQTKAKSNQ